MRNHLRKVRKVSLAIIVGGLLVIGGPTEPAEASMGCQFCTMQCPANLEQFCNERGCGGGWNQCVVDGTCWDAGGQIPVVRCALI